MYIETLQETVIFPAKNFVTSLKVKNKAVEEIKKELAEYAATVENRGLSQRIRASGDA